MNDPRTPDTRVCLDRLAILADLLRSAADVLLARVHPLLDRIEAETSGFDPARAHLLAAELTSFRVDLAVTAGACEMLRVIAATGLMGEMPPDVERLIAAALGDDLPPPCDGPDAPPVAAAPPADDPT